jgi:hypothetical protein
MTLGKGEVSNRETGIVHLGGMARPDAQTESSETEPQGELDYARKIVLAGYLTK